jgi:hypothetical protein
MLLWLHGEMDQKGVSQKSVAPLSSGTVFSYLSRGFYYVLFKLKEGSK